MPACGPDADIWGEDDNARLYDAFARQHWIYRDTSRDLIALAGLSADAAVLDLACGTGVTGREILAALGPGGTVTGADRSAAMLAVAAGAIADPRISWVQAPAEAVDQHVTGPADAVVCNSAIWQADLAATAAAVRNLLVTGGRFVFNVGAGYLGQQEDPSFGDGRPSPVTVMRDIATRDYGWRPPGPAAPPGGRPRPTRESICRCLDGAGFDVEQVTEFTYHRDAGAERAWLSVPRLHQVLPSRPALPGPDASPRQGIRPPRRRPAGAITLGCLRRPGRPPDREPVESHIHRMGKPSNAASNTRRVQWLHREFAAITRRAHDREERQMPLFMDMHNVDGGVSAADVAGAHEADLATQGAYAVNYLRYWVDPGGRGAAAGGVRAVPAGPDQPVSRRPGRGRRAARRVDQAGRA
jgi:SAM-dependent methyltransferase